MIRLALVTSLVGLAACSSAPPLAPSASPGLIDTPPSTEQQQLEFKLASGTYRCDMGQRVEVQRAPGDNQLIQIGWTGKRYQLTRNPSHSGLPRFEDSRSGLVWIDLPWKSILLDGQTNRPLASECKLS
ncbi:hypothetical protein GPA25_08825 [Aromatoleum diolicum]|uniref:C-type lysozyme inhibitor domain-containing protein n=1 Tax=Aromatoleum diolicum TaxID=75796 RepID=A0ABX1Q908_9RHOO|nr:hypothetical protein [Aromatoleum diolicum]